jgi:hypothetical protein
MPGLVIGLGKDEESGEDDVDPRSEGQEAAAQDMMDAIKADNPRKFAAALQEFLLLGPSEDV